jgi:hypothetical protein
VQGGSVVKVEEEEETALRERWVVTYGRASVYVYVYVSCTCARAPSVGEERCNRGIEGERERKRDPRRCHMLTEFPRASNIKAVFIRPPCAYATAFETRIKFLTSH